MRAAIRKGRYGYLVTFTVGDKQLPAQVVLPKAEALQMYEAGDRQPRPVVHFVARDLLLLGGYGLFRPDYVSAKSEKVQ